MKYFLISIIFITAIFQDCFAQIHHEADPISFVLSVHNKLDFVELTALNGVSRPESNTDKLPLYAGYKLPFDKNGMTNGEWNHLKNGWHVWRLGVRVDDAKGINFYFNDLQLGKNEMLFVYSIDRSSVLGAFSETNNGKYFATEFIPGESVIIEFNTLINDGFIPFDIKNVGVSVLDISGNERGFGDSDDCEILVNCPEGDNWQDERNSVARILVSEGTSLFWCTGSLMNNTNLDATPYLLTANHCGENSSEEDYSGWVFYFNFQSEDCEMPVLEPDHHSMTGATLIAHANGSTSSGSDFKLLLLKDDVPDPYAPFYNGWDRTGNGATSGIGIHHPEGDLKMISTYSNPLVSTDYNNENPNENGNYWKVVWSETETGHGVTEGGSSGSPIFSQDGFVVGTLSGGRASCLSQDLPDYYGKFSYSWESNGPDSSQQLKPWLDPKDSGVERLKGSTIDSNLVLANFYANSTKIKVGQSVIFYNQSEGDINSYEWYFEGGNPDYSELEYPYSVEYNNAGEYDVMLIAKSYSGNDTLIISDYIHVLPTITPNPSSGKFLITFGDTIPTDLNINVTDLQGRNINFDSRPERFNTQYIYLGLQSSGIYLISIYSNGNREVLKASLIRQNKD